MDVRITRPPCEREGVFSWLSERAGELRRRVQRIELMRGSFLMFGVSGVSGGAGKMEALPSAATEEMKRFADEVGLVSVLASGGSPNARSTKDVL